MNYLNSIFQFVHHLFNAKALMVSLIKDDLRKTYLGSYLGIVWAFIQPMFMILILWFVFEVGFRGSISESEVPFVLWLISGIVPWFFVLGSVNGGLTSITSNAFLVKKIAFRISILPIVKISSAFVIHLFFVGLLISIFMMYGYSPSLYWLQLPYYMAMSFLFVLGFSWITSSIIVFFKDLKQFVALMLQLGFWVTPIFWHISMFPEKYHWILKLNPIYYIVNGFRDCFIQETWFWEHTVLTPYFMFITLFMIVMGIFVFKRLRPHFADVL